MTNEETPTVTELAARDYDGAIAVPDQEPVLSDTLAKLQEWAHTFQAMASAAEGLAHSQFVPQQYRGKPADITAAWMKGMELGFSPMASLDVFDVIQGRAALKAITIDALVKTRGHETAVIEWTNTRCVVKGRRKGDTTWQESVWDMDRADQLGLTGKDQWKKQPKTMLRWRAISEIGRMIAPDALLGIPYSAEELMDMDPVVGEVVVTTTAEKTAGKSLRAVAAERRHEAPAATEQATPGADDQAITKAQLTKLAISLKELGLTDREKGLAYLSDTIGRNVTSSKELTKAEASKVIEALAQAGTPEGEAQDPPEDPWAGNGGETA